MCVKKYKCVDRFQPLVCACVCNGRPACCVNESVYVRVWSRFDRSTDPLEDATLLNVLFGNVDPTPDEEMKTGAPCLVVHCSCCFELCCLRRTRYGKVWVMTVRLHEKDFFFAVSNPSMSCADRIELLWRAVNAKYLHRVPLHLVFDSHV